MQNVSRTSQKGKRGGVFAAAQSDYAAHGIATFPLTADKRPAVKGYGRIGLKASAELASKFADAPGVGFMAGKRSGLTVLDVDTADENVLADALARHGATPIITRTGSGNFHAWYRHNGEGRMIRPDPAKPIDILGTGVTIAPPSIGRKGAYAFAQGSLDDLDALPVMQGRSAQTAPKPGAGLRDGDGRNRALFQHCMIQAPHCDDLDALLDVARTYASDQFADAMPDAEIIKTARSAWDYQERGKNWIAGRRPIESLDGVHGLARDNPHAFALLSLLRDYHRDDEFMLVTAMHRALGWTERRWRDARDTLLSEGWITRTHKGGRGPNDPARYRIVTRA